MTNKKVRMFAGPNGSGKSTLITQIGNQYNLGFTINADVIKNLLDTQNHFNCNIFYPDTFQNRTVILEKKAGTIIVHEDFLPDWAMIYVLDKLGKAPSERFKGN